MPLQDFTPQLRTRLSRVERTVGWFVLAAVLLLIAGFVYYLYAAAERKGWFVLKINYATSLDSASGLKVGNPVQLMGFDVGEITRIVPNDPVRDRGVTVFFNIRQAPGVDYFAYIWLDSVVRVQGDFLGQAKLEVTKGRKGAPTVVTEKSGRVMVIDRLKVHQAYTNLLQELKSKPETQGRGAQAIAIEATNQINELVKSQPEVYYRSLHESKCDRPVDPNLRNYIYIPTERSVSLSDQLQGIAASVQAGLPGVFSLTNQIALLLSNANAAVAQLGLRLKEAQPILTNATQITANLRNPEGSLGEWLLPTNLNLDLRQALEAAQATLQSAHGMLDHSDSNLTAVATDLDHTLAHLADLTSNLNWQVQENTNLLSRISKSIVDTDSFIQGLKRHWFLRSAFKRKEAPKKPGP